MKKTISFYHIKTACNLFYEITLSSANGLDTFYLNPVFKINFNFLSYLQFLFNVLVLL